MQDFRRLSVWQKAHELTLAVYETTRRYPKEELYGLTSQSRRSAASIPTNIAEGCGRGSRPDFARFLQIACGSAAEVEYHLLLARDLSFLDPELHDRLAAKVCEVKQMLTALIRKVKLAGSPATRPPGNPC
jgi:four helix bundle protein